MGAYQVQYLDGAQESAGFVSRAGAVKISYENGDVFTGRLDARKVKQGQGVLEFAPRRKGEEDAAEGEAAGCSYSGQFMDGERTGVAKMTYADGTSYRGQFVKGLKHGAGSYAYADGDLYSGQWANDQRSGPGTYLFSKSGCSLDAIWDEGQPVQGVFTHPDGTSVSASYVRGTNFASDALISFKSGMKLEGEFYSVQDRKGQYQVRWAAC
jgi:hypothetical protein